MFAIRRKRRRPTDLYERFASCLALVEQAKEHLLDVVPSARRPGIPLAEGLLGFDASLRGAQQAMHGWRDDLVREQWDACERALTESLLRAERLRLDAPDLEFEPLLAAVTELIEPLDAFEDAADRLRTMDR